MGGAGEGGVQEDGPVIRVWVFVIVSSLALAAIERSFKIQDQLDILTLSAWPETPLFYLDCKLAPETTLRRFNQHRFCMLCGDFMDTSLVERHEKSTVFGLCEKCWAKKNGGEEVVKMARITALKVTLCQFCKKHINGKAAKVPGIDYSICSDCNDALENAGFVVISCAKCDAYVGSGYFKYLANPLMLYMDECGSCEEKKPTDLEQFKKTLAEWEPKAAAGIEAAL